MLKRGGSAVDAAIAVQAMLSLVEPQSSGVGGGAFMTYFDAHDRQDHRLRRPRGRPGASALDHVPRAHGKPLPFATAVLSGRATGVPGRGEDARRSRTRNMASCPGAALFGDAEQTARAGLHRLPRLARHDPRRLRRESARPTSIAYFSQGRRHSAQGRRPAEQPAYADFLRRLAAQGHRRRSTPVRPAAKIVARTHARARSPAP